MSRGAQIVDLESSAHHLRSDLDAPADAGVSQLARRIRPGAVVLDLDAGTEEFVKYLSAPGQTVDGLFPVSSVAPAATSPFYRRVVHGSPEEEEVVNSFPAHGYDVVVCGEAIERAAEPQRVLEFVRRALKPQGVFLAIFSNVAYAQTLASLLDRGFPFRLPSGLEPHEASFFTRRSLAEWLQGRGFKVRDIVAMRGGISGETASALTNHSEALTRAFLVEASQLHSSDAVKTVGNQEALPGVRATLSWRLGHTSIAADHATSTVLNRTSERARLTFSVPKMKLDPTELRLEISSGPGLLELSRLEFQGTDGYSHWSWHGRADEERLTPSGSSLPLPGRTVASFLTVSDDVQFGVPIPAHALQEMARGGTLSADLSFTPWVDLSARSGRSRAASRARRGETVGLRARGADETTAIGGSAGAGSEVVSEKLEAVQEQLEEVTRQLESLVQEQRASLESKARSTYHRQLGRLYRLRREAAPRAYLLKPVPERSLRTDGPDSWEARGPDAAFLLKPESGKIPYGLLDLQFTLKRALKGAPPVLYVDTGKGFREENRINLPYPVDGTLSAPIFLPERVRALRLDPVSAPGHFEMSRVELRERTRVEEISSYAKKLARSTLQEPSSIPASLRSGLAVWKSSGRRGIAQLIEQSVKTDFERDQYRTWTMAFDRLDSEDRSRIQSRIAHLRLKPLFSLVVFIGSVDSNRLKEMLDSVLSQLYPNWEVLLVHGGGSGARARSIVEEFARREPRIREVHSPGKHDFTTAANTGLREARGELIAFVSAEDQLREHALYLVAETLNERPQAQLVYTDQDQLNPGGERISPAFKTDFSPELLLSENYIRELAAFRKQLLLDAGGIREGFEGAELHDLLLRCSEIVDARDIVHVAWPLYQSRSDSFAGAAERDSSSRAGKRAVEDSLVRRGLKGAVELGPSPGTFEIRQALPAEPPKVAIIIPTRDGLSLLRQCLNSLDVLDYPRVELIIVDNQSTDKKTLAYFESLTASGRARVLVYPHAFNYSSINNFAAAHTDAEVLCLLNNDIEAIDAGWLTQMVCRALRPGVGAVGAKLLYPDDRVQHAGVIAGMGGVAGHVLRLAPRNKALPASWLSTDRNTAAVTAACLVVRRDRYLEVGGLNEQNLSVAFNDVDFCFKLVEAGYRNIWTPTAELYHHESATRGYEDTPEKQARFEREVRYMQRRWPELIARDPFYNPNLTLELHDLELAWPPRTVAPWRSNMEPQ